MKVKLYLYSKRVYGHQDAYITSYHSQQDAHIHCKYGHNNVMPILTAGCPYSLVAASFTTTMQQVKSEPAPESYIF